MVVEFLPHLVELVQKREKEMNNAKDKLQQQKKGCKGHKGTQ